MIDLYHGDCLEILPTLEAGSVDCVLTDPPYCSGGFSETAKRQAKGQGLRSKTMQKTGWFVNDNMGTAGLIWLLRGVAVESYRILKDGGSFCLFTDWRMFAHLAPALESSGLRFQNLIVWDKGSMGLGRGFRPRHELILHYVKGVGTFHDKATGNVLTVPRILSADKEHQTEKPVALLRKVAKVISPKGGAILDPFMGSGSTGVACIEEGRRFIGIEKDEHYFNVAKNRLEQEQSKPRTMRMELA